MDERKGKSFCFINTQIRFSGFWLLQPGSTVVTSMTEDEAKPKHAFIIEFHGNNKKPEITPIPLLTPRQVYVEEADMDVLRLAPPCENVRLESGMEDERYVMERINEILENATATHNGRQPLLPMVRIKLTYSGSWRKVPPLSTRKIASKFVDRVANYSEILAVSRERNKEPRRANDPIEQKEIRNDEKAAAVIQRLVS
jgi:double-strand break repair protein MRE11